MKKVAIGGGQGFWGDSPDAAIHMIRNADIQYMGCDYLAELTLSIMAKQQLKDPTKGFAPDFTTRILKEAGKEAWDKHIKICTNAGGMNINGCVDGIRQWAEGNSMSGYKIGYVTGDNIKDKIPQLLKDGWTFPNFDYDGNFNDILDKIYNCNVYIGHEGIPPLYILKSVEALNIVTETLCSNDFQRLPAVCTIGRTQIHAYRPRRFRFTFHSAMLHQVDTAHDGTGFNCFPAVCPCLAYRAISHIAITPLKSGTQG